MSSKALSTTLSVLLLVAASLAGCTQTPPPAAPTPPAAQSTPAAKSATALTAPITSEEDYVAKATVAMDALTAIFKGAGTDCDKLAADLDTFTGQHQAFLKATREYETAHVEAQKKLEDAAKTNMQDFEAAAQPAVTACKDSARLKAAMDKLAED